MLDNGESREFIKSAPALSSEETK
jgi:hypothetical protein